MKKNRHWYKTNGIKQSKKRKKIKKQSKRNVRFFISNEMCKQLMLYKKNPKQESIIIFSGKVFCKKTIPISYKHKSFYISQ